MRKLALVVVLSMAAVSVAAADDAMKKKEAPGAAAKPPAPTPPTPPGPGDKAMKGPDQPAPPMPTPPTTPPKPGPELAALAMLAQNWTCEGTAKDPATGADVAYKSTWKNKWDLNKLWIMVEYKQTMKSKPPTKFTGRGFLGYDTVAKTYMFSGVDDWGGYIALRAPGFDAASGSIAFLGDGSGPMGKMPMRLTFAKGANDKQMTFKIEVQVQAGKDWMQAQTETCKR